MKDKTLIDEVRKKVAMLEGKHEMIANDLEAARGFLAMLERELANSLRTSTDQSHTDFIADIIVDLLSRSRNMHRTRILEAVLAKGVHIGNDGNRKRQLATLSSIMSKDVRFKPIDGKNGHWGLSTPSDDELPEDLESPEDLEFLGRFELQDAHKAPGESSDEQLNIGIQEGSIVTGRRQKNENEASSQSAVCRRRSAF